MAEQEDLSALIFQLRAAEYRAIISDAAFDQLVAAKPERTAGVSPRETALLSEVLYEVAREQQFSVPSLGHLVRALGEDDRLAEAAMFCDRWIELASTDEDAHFFRAHLACRMVDLIAATRTLHALRGLRASEALLLGIETMIILSFSDGSKSADRAREMLDAGCRKVWAVPLATEAAFRARDADLLVRIIGLAPASIADAPAHRQQDAQRTLRARLLEVLRSGPRTM